MPAATASAAQVPSLRPIPIKCYTSASLPDRKRSPAGLTMRMEPTTTTKGAAEESLAAPVEIAAIVPARNEEQVIAACVESLARQPEIAQILVVNDQSTDGTADLVRGLMAEIPQLRL